MPYKDKDKQRRAQREWKQRRRQEWLDENGPCQRCGSAEELEVDHINRGQKVDHKVWTWTKERRILELAKCQVLCRRCHLAKTAEENSTAEHGTDSKYNGGCRCIICRKAHAEYNAAWRKNRNSLLD